VKKEFTFANADKKQSQSWLFVLQETFGEVSASLGLFLSLSVAPDNLAILGFHVGLWRIEPINPQFATFNVAKLQMGNLSRTNVFIVRFCVICTLNSTFKAFLLRSCVSVRFCIIVGRNASTLSLRLKLSRSSLFDAVFHHAKI